MSSGWRYLTFRLKGDGTESLLHGELPFDGPSLTRKLSAPHQISATLNVPDVSLVAPDGRPMFARRQTAIYAEDPNGKIWVGGIVQDVDIDGPKITLDVAGFTSFAKGQFYDGEDNFVGIEAFELVRTIWAHIQSKPGGNIGLQIDSGSSGVLSGTEPEQVDFVTSSGQEVSFTAGPVKLNWYTTDDLGGKVDSLASDIPLEYLEHHFWDNDAAESPTHFLELGHPTIGRQRNELRFALGENVFLVPSENLPGEDVVTEVLVLGSGEGKDRVRGQAAIYPENSLRSPKIIDDKKITSNAEANRRAMEELAAYQRDVLGGDIDTLVISNHSNAPLGSYDVGDVIPYIGDHDYGEVEVWVKILELTVQPGTSDDVTARVTRVDTMTG